MHHEDSLKPGYLLTQALPHFHISLVGVHAGVSAPDITQCPPQSVLTVQILSTTALYLYSHSLG